MPDKPSPSQKSKWLYWYLRPPQYAGWFCLIWNVFDVHGAVGLGTVGYLTALGVAFAGALPIGFFAQVFWSSKPWAEKYDLSK